MINKDEIIQIIYNSIESVNEQYDLNIQKEPDTILFGEGSDLDSIGLVSLIVSIEEGVEMFNGKYIPLANEMALSAEESPFRTVETLSNFILLLNNECC